MNNSICTLFDNILIDIHKFKSLLYYSKRLVIDSLLAEFNQCYTEGRIDEIRQMLVEKEK